MFQGELPERTLRPPADSRHETHTAATIVSNYVPLVVSASQFDHYFTVPSNQAHQAVPDQVKYIRVEKFNNSNH